MISAVRLMFLTCMFFSSSVMLLVRLVRDYTVHNAQYEGVYELPLTIPSYARRDFDVSKLHEVSAKVEYIRVVAEYPSEHQIALKVSPSRRCLLADFLKDANQLTFRKSRL
jgi:hypothetical protein